MKIKVAILDDQYIVLNGVQHMLSLQPDIEVTGLFQNKKELEEGLLNNMPDILLLDIRMPDESGDAVAAWLKKRNPGIKILALTNFDTIPYVKKMMKLGVEGYLLKNTDIVTLIGAITTVYNGETYIEPSIKEQILNESLSIQKKVKQVPTLTKRELEILTLIVNQHATSQEIADILFLSLRTVESHRYHLFQKLGVKNVSGLVAKSLELGILD